MRSLHGGDWVGGFHLVLRGQAARVEQSLAVFARRGMQLATRIPVGGLDLYLFRKKWIDEDNIVELRNFAWKEATVVGTLVYKKRLGRAAVLALANDIIDGSLDHDRVSGDFFFFMWGDRILRVFQSRNDLFHIYVNKGRSALGSSFLAVAAGEGGPPRINKRAVLQNLLTGCQFGGTTLIEGIERVPTVSGVAGSFGFQVIEPSEPSFPAFRSFDEAVDGIERELDRYVGGLSLAGIPAGVSVGLSGGYDSRLLLGLLAKHGIGVIPHTHYRDPEDTDGRIARKLAEWAGRPILTVPVPPVGELSPARMCANLEESYWICDGNARVNLGWLSEFRRESYRRGIAGGAKMGLNGICGELFRNLGHFALPARELTAWAREFVLESFGWWFVRDGSRHDVLESLISDVRSALGWDAGKRRLNRRDHRDFYHRGWVIGGPSLRNNIEHPCWYFLSPFCERRVVDAALAASDFVGPDARLEQELIRRCSTDLARIESNYGHAFTLECKKDPIRGWLKGLTPSSVKHLRRRVLLSRQLGRSLHQNGRIVRVCHKELSAIKALDLPLEWSVIMSDDWALNRAVAVGHFLLKQGCR